MNAPISETKAIDAAKLLSRVRRARHYLRTDMAALVEHKAIAELLDDVDEALQARDDLAIATAPVIYGGEQHTGWLGTTSWLLRRIGRDAAAEHVDGVRKQLEAAHERARRERLGGA